MLIWDIKQNLSVVFIFQMNGKINQAWRGNSLIAVKVLPEKESQSSNVGLVVAVTKRQFLKQQVCHQETWFKTSPAVSKRHHSKSLGITKTPDAWEVQEAAWSKTEYQR